MSAPLWYLLIGGILIVMAAGVTLLKRLPLSTAMIYLVVGFALGPSVLGVARLDFAAHATLIEHATEIVVLLSLFSVGLKLRAPPGDERWSAPVRLATLAMLVTIALVGAAGHAALGLALPAALLLAAILAPTDPVLAGEVQVAHAFDRDRLRFALTGEAGLNDGAAFPFVLLALGLLGHHPLGPAGLRWAGVDLIWGVAGGLGIGWLAGRTAGRTVVWLRARHRESVGLDDFLALGLIAGCYGLATLVGAYGFLAVFAAGLSLRENERASRGDEGLDENGLPDPSAIAIAPTGSALGAEEMQTSPLGKDHPATNPEKAAAFLAAAVLGFNTQLERIAEVAAVTAAGVLLSNSIADDSAAARAASWWPAIAAAGFVLFIARPAAVLLCAIGSQGSRQQRLMAAWFGVRGVGSLYYLAFAIGQGLDANSPTVLAIERATLVTVAASIVLHGITVTPAMAWYARRCERSV